MKNQLKKIISASILMLSCFTSNAQLSKVESDLSASKKTSLHVGDKVPDRFFKVNNDKNKQINLATFKGKWILLDLWGVYCGSCIEHMPDAESLQRQFKDSLKVILVTNNSDLQVEKVAKIAANVRNSKLPFVNGKDQIAGLFDFSYVPLYIWIDPNGIIKYMTNDQFSDDSVKNILSGKRLNVAERKAIIFEQSEVPIITNLYPLMGDNFYIYSYLAPHDISKYNYKLGTKSSLYFKGLPKMETGNYSFKSLYAAAYGYQSPQNPLPDERVIINFNDTLNYADPAHYFDYEIIVHKNIPETRVRKYMQNELDLFFNVKSHIEKRMAPCLIFKRLNNGHNCFADNRDTITYDRYGDNRLIASIHWKTLFGYINFLDLSPPHTLIDETGITADKVVKFDISLDFDDPEKMAKSLAPYGLTIVREDRMLDCIVVEDIK